MYFIIVVHLISLISIWSSYITSFSSYRIYKHRYPSHLPENKTPPAFYSWGVIKTKEMKRKLTINREQWIINRTWKSTTQKHWVKNTSSINTHEILWLITIWTLYLSYHCSRRLSCWAGSWMWWIFLPSGKGRAGTYMQMHENAWMEAAWTTTAWWTCWETYYCKQKKKLHIAEMNTITSFCPE